MAYLTTGDNLATYLGMLVACLGTLGVVHAQGEPGLEDKHDPRAPASMINALANRNSPPKVVKSRGGPSRPLFPRGYDWEEQDRVRASISALLNDPREEVWAAMLRKTDDNRYCITEKDGGDNPWDRTVGYFCRQFAAGRLIDAYHQHLPADRARDGRPIRLEVFGSGGWPKWLAERKGKALYQLQIELCEKALVELAKAKRVPRKEREAARAKIEKEIKNLKATKKPFFRKKNIDGLDVYSRVEAERIRAKLERKK